MHLFSILLAGCTGTSLGDLSADAALLLSATSGAEEKTVSSGDAASPDDLPAELQPDPFRTCDADATYADLFGQFDADTDGQLDAAEESEVQDVYAGAPGGPDRLWMQWGMLLLAYDEDLDGVLADSERATLLTDFTTRCEALQARLVADFDTDGDGVLSDAEQTTAEETLAEQAAEHHSCEGMDGPDGESGRGPGGPPPEASVSVNGVPIPPPLLEEFDTDSDGALDDTEVAALRTAIRARITSGEPLMGEPGGH